MREIFIIIHHDGWEEDGIFVESFRGRKKHPVEQGKYRSIVTISVPQS